MMAAVFAARGGNEVHLYEKNEKLGKKLFITGKGRCNITNSAEIDELFSAVVSNPKFLYSSFYSLTNDQVIEFFEELGVKTKVERGGRVFPESDHSSDVIRALEQDQTTYVWGLEDGRGLPIQMTMAQYLDRYVWDADYTRAPELGIDQIITGGNALENLAEAYKGCRFVDFCYPSADPVNDGLDWSSLKLVFQAGEHSWYLVGIVHGEWTI